MKIIGLLGSPRGKNSNTMKLLESALEGAKESGADVEIVDLTKKDIGGCKACTTCYKTGSCVLKDDFNGVYRKVLDADGIILASPVYFNSVSAQLKSFMDRTADCRHCLLFAGKYGMSVATTASSGADSTVQFMNEYLSRSGAFTIGGVGVTGPYAPGNMEAGSEKANAMGRDLVSAISSKKQFPEQRAIQMAFIGHFKDVVEGAKGQWTHEYQHYKAMGWL
jgi:multimeric flavodoxin WrbA